MTHAHRAAVVGRRGVVVERGADGLKRQDPLRLAGIDALLVGVSAAPHTGGWNPTYTVRHADGTLGSYSAQELAVVPVRPDRAAT